jgi:hypothetical protein
MTGSKSIAETDAPQIVEQRMTNALRRALVMPPKQREPGKQGDLSLK